MNSVVLDASAMLAYLYNEQGADLVENALVRKTYIGSVNWAEVLSKVSDKGYSPEDLVTLLTTQGLLNNSLEIVTMTEADAMTIAQLRPQTKSVGLSLGDRACLALGLRLKLPVLTADRAWDALQIDLSIQIIR